MKNGWKVFWIVCAVLAAVGFLMTAAGAALGGFAMLDDPGAVSVDGGEFDGGYVPGEPDGDMITAYEGVGAVSLDLPNLGVMVIPSDDDALLVDTSQLRKDIRDAIVISQEGEELEVDTAGAAGHRWSGSDTGFLYICVPQGTYFDSFSADVGAGLLEMQGISAGELSLEVGAGQTIAEEFYADVLEADCGAGQMTLRGEVVRNADLNCDIGEVLFTLPGETEAYNYALSCSAGELIVGDEAYSGIRNQMKIDNGSECVIDAECRIGRMEIMFE